MTSQPRTLLIVDDETAITDILVEILEPLGLELKTAHDAEAALEIVHSMPLCGILCDIGLPKMSGVDFLAQIRAEGYQTPLAFITAYDDRTRIMGAMRLGAFDYIVKPFNFDAVSTLTTRLIEVGTRLLHLEELQARMARKDPTLTETDFNSVEKLKKMTQLFQVQHYKKSS